MQIHIVVIRDIKADCFGQPNFVLQIGAAIRGFGDQVQAKDDNPLAKHPEDYELYKLGVYEDGDASFELLPKPQQLAVGSDFARR